MKLINVEIFSKHEHLETYPACRLCGSFIWKCAECGVDMQPDLECYHQDINGESGDHYCMDCGEKFMKENKPKTYEQGLADGRKEQEQKIIDILDCYCDKCVAHEVLHEKCACNIADIRKDIEKL